MTQNGLKIPKIGGEIQIIGGEKTPASLAFRMYAIDRTDFLPIDRTELLLINRTDFLSTEQIFYRYKNKKGDPKENFLRQKVCFIFPIWQSLQEICRMYFLPPNQFKK